jgi:hypothetical protein
MMEADENGQPGAQQILRAQAQRQSVLREETSQAKSAGMQPSLWQALGPSNVGGRVRAIAFDPRNPLRILAGTASGGLWTSEDGAATWRANQDFLPNLSITTIAFDPSDPNNVYMGTGEASGGLVGIGAFKSRDGGRTWAFLAATSVDSNLDWRFVNRIAVNPAQPQVLLAGVTNDARTMGAIYRSTDGGASWVKAAPLKATDIAFDPNDSTRAVAGLDDGTIAYSTNGGVTWAQTLPLIGNPTGRQGTARAEIAFARSQRGLVYASVDDQKARCGARRIPAPPGSCSPRPPTSETRATTTTRSGSIPRTPTTWSSREWTSTSRATAAPRSRSSPTGASTSSRRTPTTTSSSRRPTSDRRTRSSTTAAMAASTSRPTSTRRRSPTGPT